MIRLDIHGLFEVPASREGYRIKHIVGETKSQYLIQGSKRTCSLVPKSRYKLLDLFKTSAEAKTALLDITSNK